MIQDSTLRGDKENQITIVVVDVKDVVDILIKVIGRILILKMEGVSVDMAELFRIIPQDIGQEEEPPTLDT